MKKICLVLLGCLFMKVVPWYIIMIMLFIGGIVLLTLSAVNMLAKYKTDNISRLKRIEKRLEKTRKQLEKEIERTTTTDNNENNNTDNNSNTTDIPI
jgi:cell division protein FtsX